MNRTICWICFPTSASFILDDDLLITWVVLTNSRSLEVRSYLVFWISICFYLRSDKICLCVVVFPILWMDERQRREGERKPNMTNAEFGSHACMGEERSAYCIHVRSGGTHPPTKFGFPFLPCNLSVGFFLIAKAIRRAATLWLCSHLHIFFFNTSLKCVKDN
jgi:hypothetical protein